MDALSPSVFTISNQAKLIELAVLSDCLTGFERAHGNCSKQDKEGHYGGMPRKIDRERRLGGQHEGRP